jgi:hypothetical protein
MNISEMSDPGIRPMSTADRYAIAKTAWNASMAWIKNTGDSNTYEASWDQVTRRKHDQILMLTVMGVHRAIAIGNDHPSIGNVWDLGYDPDRNIAAGLPHRESPVAEVFVRIATTLVLLWMKHEQEGFYVITRGAAKSAAPEPGPGPFERGCTVVADDGTTCQLEFGHGGPANVWHATRGNYWRTSPVCRT